VQHTTSHTTAIRVEQPSNRHIDADWTTVTTITSVQFHMTPAANHTIILLMLSIPETGLGLIVYHNIHPGTGTL